MDPISSNQLEAADVHATKKNDGLTRIQLDNKWPGEGYADIGLAGSKRFVARGRPRRAGNLAHSCWRRLHPYNIREPLCPEQSVGDINRRLTRTGCLHEPKFGRLRRRLCGKRLGSQPEEGPTSDKRTRGQKFSATPTLPIFDFRF